MSRPESIGNPLDGEIHEIRYCVRSRCIRFYKLKSGWREARDTEMITSCIGSGLYSGEGLA